ncbi:hypothetical protein Vadar_009496 [Vaccinium darrowii]|uniref:Uncharacterized protein n=1 Tax=Vaccinium darrowii TaxID=229202 RepID=A0ACB7YEV3_9ERIC|nr:hypothetical protein Vadar_009496 [Vaccinium darrowii]
MCLNTSGCYINYFDKGLGICRLVFQGLFLELNMVQKRPFSDEESFEGSSKHHRQFDFTNQVVSFLQFIHAEETAQPPKASGEVGGSFKEGNEKHEGGITSELPLPTENNCTNEEDGAEAPFELPLPTENECTNEEDGAEAPFYLLLSPERYYADRHIGRIVVDSEETHGSLLESLPHKLVPIGPDYQAEIPEWGAAGAKNASDNTDGFEPLTLFPRGLESHLSKNCDVENKLGGICVIPMPESGLFANNDGKAGNGRTDCNCDDSDSARCVRQHIKEARENLWTALGQERFLGLGFSDMGEVVAEKWNQEEELLFRKVVFSNPISLGNNFWDHLSMVFPMRAKRDIVSYYFNVFMLQTRSVQNRHDPMNIDSDDDEWWGIVDSGDDEGGSDEEDGDSAVESPAYYGDPYARNKNLDDESGECDGSASFECFSDCENVKFGCDEGTINNSSKGHLGSFVGRSGGDSHEYVLDHCETWDVGCSMWPKNEAEFLPTCSMIEEVFGLGSLDYMAGDGKGLS